MKKGLDIRLDNLRNMNLDGVIIKFDIWSYTPLLGDADLIINCFLMDLCESLDIEIFVFDYDKALAIKDFLLNRRDYLVSAMRNILNNEHSLNVSDSTLNNIIDKAVDNIDKRVERYGAFLTLETDINY